MSIALVISKSNCLFHGLVLELVQLFSFRSMLPAISIHKKAKSKFDCYIAITSKAVVLLTLKRFNWFTEPVVKEKLFVDILSSLSTSHTFSDLRPTNKQYQLQLNQNLEQSINKMARRCVNEVLFREIGGGPIIVCVPDNLKPSLKKTQNWKKRENFRFN